MDFKGDSAYNFTGIAADAGRKYGESRSTMKPDSEAVKRSAAGLGADLCGIAAAKPVPGIAERDESGIRAIEGISAKPMVPKMQDRSSKLVLWVLVTLSLALTSCGGREGASPTLPLLVAGGNHTVAIKKDGTLWAWGANRSGELGNGTNKSSYTRVQIVTDTNWLSVAAGWYTVAIKNDVTLWAWGHNYFGQLGDGTNMNSPTPLRLGKRI
jgi:hypothetical protein